MSVLHANVQFGATNSDNEMELPKSANKNSRGPYPLSAQEVKAVAGGPEADVGNSVTPP
jgi:hypothetical protein